MPLAWFHPVIAVGWGEGPRELAVAVNRTKEAF